MVPFYARIFKWYMKCCIDSSGVQFQNIVCHFLRIARASLSQMLGKWLTMFWKCRLELLIKSAIWYFYILFEWQWWRQTPPWDPKEFLEKVGYDTRTLAKLKCYFELSPFFQFRVRFCKNMSKIKDSRKFPSFLCIVLMFVLLYCLTQ